MNAHQQYKTRFEKDLAKCGIELNEVEQGDLIIAAVSGGMDSMLLAHAFKITGAKFEVAHVNFKLRGEDSEGDAESVKKWCLENDVVCHVKHLPADDEAKQRGDGIQDAARRLRYAWFEELRAERGAAAIAVAHHLNDQAETLLIQLLRSVDPIALGGMGIRNGNVIRPFLDWKSEDIKDWVALDEVTYRDDKSNAELKYMRNRIRHEVLPLLESIRSGTVEHLAEWTVRLKKQGEAVESSMKEAARDIISYSDMLYNDLKSEDSNEICRVNIIAMKKNLWGERVVDRMLAQRVWSKGAREEALKLCKASVGAEVCYGEDSVLRERDSLILRRKVEEKLKTKNESNSCLVEGNIGCVEGLVWALEPGRGLVKIPSRRDVLWMDSRSFDGPLTWRCWRNGDKLYPSGMDGSVNVSDILTQWKIPNHLRGKAHVLVNRHGQLLWVYSEGEHECHSRISRLVTLTGLVDTLILKARL